MTMKTYILAALSAFLVGCTTQQQQQAQQVQAMTCDTAQTVYQTYQTVTADGTVQVSADAAHYINLAAAVLNTYCGWTTPRSFDSLVDQNGVLRIKAP